MPMKSSIKYIFLVTEAENLFISAYAWINQFHKYLEFIDPKGRGNVGSRYNN